ncbi:MAG: exodeoxyribonuclease V subunit beta [Candidatus Methylumidiphilus sp.]
MTIATPLNPLTFPLNGASLIEASAGTGKTWTIAALYVRLVLGHGSAETGAGRALLPPEILVVTFTEAATKELRDRIRKRLTDAARCFRGIIPGDAFLTGLAEDYPAEQHTACARLLEVAAQWMDEASVFTIHGWCNRMLRQHAFDSGSLFNLEIENADTELLNEVARDYWRTFFYPLDAEASLAVTQIADSPKTLLGLVQGLLREAQAEWRNGDQPFASALSPKALLQAWGDWESWRRVLETQAQQAWAADRVNIEALLWQAVNNGWLNGNSYRKDAVAARLDGIAAWAGSNAVCESKHWMGFAQSRFKMNKKHEANTPMHPAFVALDTLAGHLEQEPDCQREILVHAARWVRERYALEKQRRARMDFDDLLKHLDKALQGPGGGRLAEVIRAQYPVALIDEFQDTDPVQYRIFSSVYPVQGTQGALMMIGDPKQAIYSFRGADIYAYLLARQSTAGRHYTLDQNFRSTHDMVAAVNRFFEYADSQAGGAFKFQSADGDNPLPFYPVQAQGRSEHFQIAGETQTALTLWHLPPQDDQPAVAMGEYRGIMAEVAASEIVRLLNAAALGKAGFRSAAGFTRLRPADLAVLVRDRNEAAAIRQALLARRVRSVYLSERESVYDTAEAADMLLWLRACAEPERERAVRAALGTGTLALSYAELEILNSEEARWEAEVERFRAYRKVWRFQGVLPMLRRLMADFEVPGRLLQTQEGERRLTNLLHLAELLQTASVDLDGEHALIRHLTELRDSTDQAADEALLRLESDAALVKVVTIHKAKGLEYPLVFLPFICSYREVKTTGAYYRFHDAAGQLLLDLGKAEASRQHADLERLQEDLRLLYVALTRPRHACWLGVAPVKSGNFKACLLEKSAMGQVLNGGQSLSAEALGPALAALRGDCAAIAITPPPPIRHEAYAPPADELPLTAARAYRARAAERWWIASYTALRLDLDGQTLDPARPPLAEPPDTPRQANLEEAIDDIAVPAGLLAGSAFDMHRFPRGAKPGTFLHGLLEWAAAEGFGRIAREHTLRKDAIARRCHTRGWTDWINPLNEWLAELLAAPLALPDGGGALADLRRRGYQAELEFWFAANHADTRALDRLVSRFVLPGQPRPGLLYDRLHGMLKGFIDLVFELDGRYYVLDYKSNWLGADDAAYTAEAMAAAVLEKRYDLQYSLYLLALHRQLQARLGAAYDYDQHIGGAVYLFLRGIHAPSGGLHVDKPPRQLIEALDSLFAGRGVGHVA